MKQIALKLFVFLLGALALPSGCLAGAARDVEPVLSAGVQTARQPESWQSTEDGRRWIQSVSTRLRSLTPTPLSLGRGDVTVRFRVDRAGKISDVQMMDAPPKEHAAMIRWIFDVAHLPPPPPSLLNRGCCALSQTFRFLPGPQ